MDRRSFLQASTLGLAAAGLWSCARPTAPAVTGDLRPAPVGRQPRRIIFMVSDGMSMGVPSMAQPFSRLVRGGRGTHLTAMLESKATTLGFFDTSSLSSLVTDSSAASSAWSTGTRVFNAAVNMLPDGTRLDPIMHLARKPGRGLGLVTTTTMTHATPAGFASVNERRDDEAGIAPQYKDVVDVLLGGGLRFFDKDMRGDGRDLIAEYTAAGYHYMADREALMAAPKTGKLLGLFSKGHIPFTIDQLASEKLSQSVPTLAEMTRAALDRLAQKPEGFLLQVEGGRVDHAAHANDIGALLHDQLAFDDAIGVALEFAAADDDTLVIVTSDHGNANPGLNGLGPEYIDSTGAFARIGELTTSLDPVRDDIVTLAGTGKTPTVDQVRQVVSQRLAIQINDAEAAAVAGTMSIPPAIPIERIKKGFTNTLGAVLSNYLGVAFTGSNHTQDHTLVAAIGPGQERWHGLRRNTDAFGLMASALGITHRNPVMTPEAAQPFLEKRAAMLVPTDRQRDDWA